MLQKKEKNQESKLMNAIIDWYKSFCYHLIGKRIRSSQKTEYLQQKLLMADMNLTAEGYISLIIITGLLATVISSIIFYIIFSAIINIESWSLYVIGLGSLTSIISFTYFPFVVSSRMSNRKTQIDQSLPFALSELSILASTGLTPIRIFRTIAQNKEETAINSEFKKIIYKTDVQGKDIITAISETAKETPSDSFREALWDIGNMIHQGGDLDIYLRDKADITMQLKRDIQKEFIDKLGTYAEMYISLILIGVLFLGIAAFLIDAMGTTMAGIDSETLLILLSFGLIPVATFAVNLIVSMAYSKNG